jgi:hypothetical protein
VAAPTVSRDATSLTLTVTTDLPTHSPAPARLVSLHVPHPRSVPILPFSTYLLILIYAIYPCLFPFISRPNYPFYLHRASPSLPAVYMMPSRGIRVPCTGRSTVWRRFARTSIHRTPSRDAATKPSGPTALGSPHAQSYHFPSPTMP